MIRERIESKIVGAIDQIETGTEIHTRSKSKGLSPEDLMISKILAFDENQIPPALDLAYNHRNCNLFGKKSSNLDLESLTYCPCCASVKQVQYPLCVPTNELDSYGPVIPLFFQLFKFLIIMTIVYLVVGLYVEYNIVIANCTVALADKSRRWEGCPFTLATLIDTSERDKDRRFFQKDLYITPALWLASVILFVCYHYFERKLVQKIKHDNVMISEYTIAIYQLRSDELSDSYIRQLLNENACVDEGQEVKLDIAKICIAQYSGNIVSKEMLMEETLEKVNVLEAKIESEKDETNKKEFQMRLDETKMEAENLEVKLARYRKKIDGNKLNRNESSVAFVTFNTPSEARKIRLVSTVKWILGEVFPCFFEVNSHTILAADEPDDIHWPRVGIEKTNSFLRSIGAHLLIWFAMFVFFAIQLGSVIVQSYIKRLVEAKVSNKLLVTILSYPMLPSMVTQILNYLIIALATRLTKKEKHFSISEGTLSLTRKLIWIQFINSAGFPIALHLLSNDYGGIDNVTTFVFNMQLTNLWMNPLLHAFAPGFLIQEFWVKRRLEKRLRKTEPVTTTQKELNELLEPPELAIHVRYSSIIRTFFVSCFFFDMLPIGMLLCLIFMIIQFWVDKYMLLRRYKRMKKMSKHLPYGVSWIASSCTFLVVLGHLVVKYVMTKESVTFKNSTKAIDLAYLLTAYVLSLLNIKYIIKVGKFDSKKVSQKDSLIGDFNSNEVTDFMMKDSSEQNYQDIWIELETDYDRLNPLTKKEALKKWKEAKLGSLYKSNVYQSVFGYSHDSSDLSDEIPEPQKVPSYPVNQRNRVTNMSKLLTLERNLHEAFYLKNPEDFLN